MQSAFVDVGLDRDAFLYVSDFLDTSADFEEGEDEVAPSKRKPPKAKQASSPEGKAEETAEGGEGNQEQKEGERPEGARDGREGGGRRRRSRRGRRRGGRGRNERGARAEGNKPEGLPESKYASLPEEKQETAPNEPTEANASRQPRKETPVAEGRFEVLPGESLAKYGPAPGEDSFDELIPLEPADDRESDQPRDEPQAAESAEVRDREDADADDHIDEDADDEDRKDEAGREDTQAAFADEDQSGEEEDDDGGYDADDDDQDEAAPEDDVDEEEEDTAIDFSQHLAEAERLAALIEEQEEEQPSEDVEEATSEDEEPNELGVAEEPEITEFRSDEEDVEEEEEEQAADAEEASADDQAEDQEDAESKESADGPGQPPAEDGETGGTPGPPANDDDHSSTMPGQPETAQVRGDRSGSSRNLQRRGRRGRRRGGRSRDRQPARSERVQESSPRPEVEPAAGAGAASVKITDMLQKGNEILVQIAKEPLGKKGARITSHIALPGRYLVYMPTVDHVGVSRKIGSFDERRRLRDIVRTHRTGMPGGFIVRTAGSGMEEEEIRGDMLFLYNMWLDIRQKAEDRKNPGLVHQDLDIVERILRDQLDEDFKAIWVDAEDEYERILRFVERFQPSLLPRVKLYTRRRPIFEGFNIKNALEKAMRPKVWLKSGGYIVINQTEALVAVDVNTGKYVGKSDRLEDTIVNTNIEAAKEVVRQIRLRDLGGIIVVDFIDMDDRKNRQKVQQTLEQAMQHDPAPSKSLAFNDFGLVAITRKRVKQSLERTLCSPCSVCNGSGHLKSVTTVIIEILEEAHRMAPDMEPQRDITLRVNPEIGRTLKSRKNNYLQELETALKSHIVVRSDLSLHREKFDIAQ